MGARLTDEGVRRAASSIMALGCLTLFACSSNGSEGEGGPSFASRAASVCQAALDSKRAWSPFPEPEFNPTDPDPSALPEVADWLDEEVAATFEQWLADLRALGGPPNGADDWADVLAAVEDIVKLNAEQVDAGRAGDAGAFAAATEALEQTQTELERATEAAGVPSCAEVHAS